MTIIFILLFFPIQLFLIFNLLILLINLNTLNYLATKKFFSFLCPNGLKILPNLISLLKINMLDSLLISDSPQLPITQFNIDSIQMHSPIQIPRSKNLNGHQLKEMIMGSRHISNLTSFKIRYWIRYHVPYWFIQHFPIYEKCAFYYFTKLMLFLEKFEVGPVGFIESVCSLVTDSFLYFVDDLFKLYFFFRFLIVSCPRSNFWLRLSRLRVKIFWFCSVKSYEWGIYFWD